MIILSHRGLWQAPSERNTGVAFAKAFASGFGIETDVRDSFGALVISHDPPVGQVQPFVDLLTLHQRCGGALPLAINIKADGLCSRLQPLLAAHTALNYFCFDMSVPEMLAYHRGGLRFFTRESEFERLPVLYNESAGVWMDMFHTDWICATHISRHLDAGKQVALVSPELHRRPHEPFWERLLENEVARLTGVMLCTDLPAAAQEFFHG